MHRSSVILGFLFSSFFSFGQSRERLVLYTLSEQNGLTDNRVTCFFLDSENYMWIGTQDGLNRYDGSVITRFKSRKGDSLSLPGNYITAITEDNQHVLWIATLNGICKYDADKNSFVTYRASSARGNPNMMWDIYCDKKENIWIASEIGLIQFSIAQKKFTIHVNDNLKIETARRRSNWITKISADGEDALWLSTHFGLWRFQFNENKFEPIIVNSSKNFDLINVLTVDHKGQLWLGTWGEGLKKYDPEKKNIQQIEGDAPQNVFGITEVKNGNGSFSIWCSGLTEIDEKMNVRKYQAPNEAEQLYFQSRCYASSDGLLWVTSTAGVKIMDPSRQFFSHHYLSKNQISPQNISFLIEGNQLYIGGRDEEFLKLYDSSFQPVRTIHPSKELKAGASGGPAVLGMARENKNQIWLSTENGMALLDERTGKQNVFRTTEKGNPAPARNFFTSMLIDSKGICWVFPWRSGIWQMDRQTGVFKKIIERIASDQDGRKFVVSSAMEDKNGNIWFADLDHGLIFFDRKENSFTKPTASVLGPLYKLSKVEYENPYLWFVMEGEVVRVHVDTQKIEHWAIPEEFNKSVNDFCNDKHGRIWIATSSGLLSFDKKTHTFIRYNVNDGLVNSNMEGVLTCLSSGKVLFATDNYITEFDPDQLSKPMMKHKVVITKLLSQNQEIRFTKNKNGGSNVELDYTFNNFKFNWALLNYSNPLQNQYYCKLDGVDKDWKYVGNTGQAEYASLVPGRYTFRARATTSDGVSGLRDDLLIIVINPPFWETWWFVLLAVAAISISVYTVYRYRIDQLLLREKLRVKISTDLHDDIGSTLSSISILGDLTLQKLPPGKTSEMVKEIRDSAQMLMEKMDDIVWGINPANDSLEKLLLRIKKFASQILEAKNIEYAIHVQQDIGQLILPMDYRQHIYLIIKECLNNLVKHSQCSRASLSIEYSHSHLRIKIMDNGKGFDIQAQQVGNGLNNLKRRAKEMNADIIFNSKKEEGTTVELNVKIK